MMEDQRWSRKSSSVSDGRQEAKDEVFHPASQNNHTASTSIHPSDLKTTEREEEEERVMERRSKLCGFKKKIKVIHGERGANSQGGVRKTRA